MPIWKHKVKKKFFLHLLSILELEQWLFHDAESLGRVLNLYHMLSREGIEVQLLFIHIYMISTKTLQREKTSSDWEIKLYTFYVPFCF